MIAASIPLFFALFGVESVAARVRGRRVYGLPTHLRPLLRMLSQLTGLFITLLTYALFACVRPPGRAALSPAPARLARSVHLPAAFASWAVVFSSTIWPITGCTGIPTR
jgi:hypothetical protein